MVRFDAFFAQPIRQRCRQIGSDQAFQAVTTGWSKFVAWPRTRGRARADPRVRGPAPETTAPLSTASGLTARNARMPTYD
jgi:hypothetical protein